MSTTQTCLYTVSLAQQSYRGDSLGSITDTVRKVLTCDRAITAVVVRHARYVTFQMAEVAVPKALFEQILAQIARLTPSCDTG